MIAFALPILLLFFFAAPGVAGEAVLNRIGKEERPGATELTIELSAAAGHRVETSGKRIDLFLAGVSADAMRLPPLPESGAVIRILLARLPRELMISFLMAVPPGEVKVSTRERPAGVVLEVAWERGGQAQPGTAPPPPRRPVDGGQRAGVSPYLGQWKTFFTRYETPFAIPAPLEYSLPALPQLAVSAAEEGSAGILDLLRQASGRQEGGVVPLLRGNEPARGGEVAALLASEELARTGRAAEAAAVLGRFLAEHPGSALRARCRYLLAWARATGGEPYQARYELSLLPGEKGYEDYADAGRLLLAELALAIALPTSALDALEQLPAERRDDLAPLWAVRRGDALAGLKRDQEALAAYRRADMPGEFWRRNPLSAAAFAETLSRSGEAAAAAARYRELADALPPGEAATLARFAEARCRLAAGERGRALELMTDAARLYPHTDGGWRSRLKLADLSVIGEATLTQDPLGVYEETAARAPGRALREEAALKKGILFALRGETDRSIEALEFFLRQFGGGTLRREAEALLAELLPSRVDDLIARGEDMAALVLAERYRDRLLSVSMAPPFLLRLGEASERVGLLERAIRIYRLLIEGHGGRPEGEKAHAALARVLLYRHDFAAAAEAARRYLARYPRGAARTEAFAVLVEALSAGGQLEEAAKILTAAGRPSNPRIEALAGRVFWRRGELQRAQQTLAGAGGDGQEQPGFALLSRAEALYGQEKWGEALPLYEQLASDGLFADQALFRCAQIRLARGERQPALNLLRRLAEKGGETPWQRAGAEFLQLQQMGASKTAR